MNQKIKEAKKKDFFLRVTIPLRFNLEEEWIFSFYEISKRFVDKTTSYVMWRILINTGLTTDGYMSVSTFLVD